MKTPELIKHHPLIDNFRVLLANFRKVKAGELPELKREFLEQFTEDEIDILKGFLERLDKE